MEADWFLVNNHMALEMILGMFTGTPDLKNKLILIDSQWLVKINGATIFFMEKLRNKFLRGQFWPCLTFAPLSVPSGMAQNPDF